MRPDPIIYFAGVAQHSLCSWFAGMHVLESYANLLDGVKGDGENGLVGQPLSEESNMSRYRLTFKGMALDCGAFSNLTSSNGPVVQIDGYIRHAVAHSDFYDFSTSFDDISGGADGNRKNWIRCMDAGIHRLMPVFHQGEPWSLLEEYVAGSHYIGLGMQRPFANARAFLDEAFSRIPDGKWVHIFAGTSFLEYPATSVDSTTWLSELLALMKDTRGQARNPLRYLSQDHILRHVVIPSYAGRIKAARWDKEPVFGVAAGRGQQIDIEEVLKEESNEA